jgi:hypothetical protein
MPHDERDNHMIQLRNLFMLGKIESDLNILGALAMATQLDSTNNPRLC